MQPGPDEHPPVSDEVTVWPVASSRDIHRGNSPFSLRSDEVRRPGHPATFTRLVLEHPGAVVVLAVDEQDRVVCLGQYRHPTGQTLVELPAGLCDVSGEDPREVARRELREEAGLEADEWTALGSAYSSPGISAELIHYFLARGLTDVGRGDFELEHEEAEMTVQRVPAGALRRAVLDGRVRDAPLAVALFLAGGRGLLS